MKHKPFTFLKWLAPLLLGIGLVLEIFGGSIQTISKLWPLWMAIALAGGFIALLKFGGERIQEFLKIEWVKKMGAGLLIAGLLALISYSLQWLGTRELIMRFGISERISWIIILGAAPFILGGVWTIFSKTVGLPGSPGAIFWGSFLISAALIGIILVTFRFQPNEFFDHKSGEVKTWVSDSEGKIYRSPGTGIQDGKPLRPFTTADAEKYGKKKLPEKKKSKIISPPQKWQMYWKKLPNVKGKISSERSKKITGRLVFKSQTLVFEWGRKGSLIGTKSTNGSYNGIWKDNKGQKGTFKELEFVVPTRMEGWMFDSKKRKAFLTIEKL